MIVIADRNPAVIAAAEANGFRTAQVDSILDLPGILVSPANSFGFMDGGIDQAYLDAYPDIEEKVQAAIRQYRDGELVVGDALLVGIEGSDKHPMMIVAPTMRTPATDLRGTLNAYLAMRAIKLKFTLLLADAWARNLPEPVLLCPGLGTASGRMDPRIALNQMAMALADTPHFSSWHNAKVVENQMRSGTKL